MYCKKCGKEIEDKAQFCPFCGESISHLTTAKEPVVEGHHTETAQAAILEAPKKKSPKKVVIIAVAVAIIAVAAVVVGIILTSSPKGEIGDIAFEFEKDWEPVKDESSDMVKVYRKDNDAITCEVKLIEKDIIPWQMDFEEKALSQNASGTPTVNYTTVTDQNALIYNYNFLKDGKSFHGVNVHFSYNRKLYALSVYTEGIGNTLVDEMDKLTGSVKFTKERTTLTDKEQLEGIYYQEPSKGWTAEVSEEYANANYIPSDGGNEGFGIDVYKKTAEDMQENLNTWGRSVGETKKYHNIFVGDRPAARYEEEFTLGKYKWTVVDIAVFNGQEAYQISVEEFEKGKAMDTYNDLVDSIRFE